MSKLSKREKILLYVLLVFVIVTAGVYFMLIPSFNRMSTSSNNYEVVALEYDLTKLEVDQLETRKTSISDTNNKITTDKQKFYSDMKSYEIDKTITTMCKKRDLKVTTLNMEVAKTETKTTATATPTTTEKPNDLFKTYNVFVQVTGNIDDVIALGNQIGKMTQIRVIDANVDEVGAQFNLEVYVTK